MDLRKMRPATRISEASIELLNPVFEGEILRQKGHYGEAEARYLEGLPGFPEGSGGRFLIYNKLGILYEKTKERTKAKAIYERAVAEKSVTPFPYQRLAVIYLAEDRLDEAMDQCRMGIRILKEAHTTFFQEAYFWLKFQSLKRGIRRRASARTS